ncbi:MAG: ABC transporter permease, partial [Clostridia bacterium]|nr:ABC transporter permease [Clostridia bacterium]
ITMVLIPSISTFYISKMLGNGLTTMIGDVIESQYQTNPHFSSALAFILMVVLLVAMALMQRYANKRAAA